jgi:hypothetical protein
MCIKINKIGKQEVEIWWVQKRFPRYGVPIWNLWPNIIFLSNYWWQKSDIWSQASYRYLISWEAFLNPSDSYFLFADFVDFYTHWTYMLIFRKCAYMFNVYRNQLSRQTGSRNLTGPKTPPTIWHTYMKLVTKYQIPIFLGNYWWQRSDIWSQASYRYPISWEAFLGPSDSYFLFADLVGFYTHWGSRNLTSPKTLPTIWYTYMTLVTKYQIAVINSYWEKCDEKYLKEGRRWI